MKTLLKSLAYAALAGFALTGCSDDDTTPKGEDVDRGDKACRIETFILNLDSETTITGDVYDYDKSIDLAYTTDQLELMKSATATLTLSEGATVSPDPSQPADYTQPISFTVNGLSSNVYPKVMFPIRLFTSSRSFARQSIAIISEAGVMSNPDSRVIPLVFPPSPVTM